MTTFIPSITLPAAVFANPTASVLLPIALGTAVGFSVRRTFSSSSVLSSPHISKSAAQQSTANPPPAQPKKPKKPTWHSNNPPIAHPLTSSAPRGPSSTV
ncbi:hypothetical protein ACMFMG_008289 [Clarireedia jacksonii]